MAHALGHVNVHVTQGGQALPVRLVSGPWHHHLSIYTSSNCLVSMMMMMMHGMIYIAPNVPRNLNAHNFLFE